MFATVISMSPADAAARASEQSDQIRAVADGFAALATSGDTKRDVARLLRDVVSIISVFDLERLPAAEGRRMAAAIADAGTILHQRLDSTLGASVVDEGLAAAAALAGMIGQSWDTLEAIPDALLRDRAARTAMFANLAENVGLTERLAPKRPDVAPAGAVLH